MITNSGKAQAAKLLNGYSSDPFNKIRLGSGSTPATVDDTSLESPITGAYGTATASFIPPATAKLLITLDNTSGDDWNVNEMSIESGASGIFSRVVFTGTKVVPDDCGIIITALLTYV